MPMTPRITDMKLLNIIFSGLLDEVKLRVMRLALFVLEVKGLMIFCLN